MNNIRIKKGRGMRNIAFTAESAEKGRRLDVVLVEHMGNHTRSQIQNLIKSKYVSVNDNTITRPGYKVRHGDNIEVRIPSIRKIEIQEEDIPLNILYEDEDIAIIDKPKGMVVHPAPGNCSGTLVNALLYHFDKLSSAGGIIRPGIVHRLDKDTSGLLIVAKNDEAHEKLTEDLKERKIVRIYWAIVERNIGQDEGVIDTPITRHPVNRKRMAVIDSGSSRRAVTHFKVLERFGEYTLVELELETGRTHQIRVHMAYIGNPIIGDTVYGSKRQKFKTNGQVLHAKRLAFTQPITGEYMELEGELPEYFIELLEILRNQ